MTQDERHAWRSIKQVQNGDLSCHLYNAFALTRQSKDQTASQDLTVILVRSVTAALPYNLLLVVRSYVGCYNETEMIVG